MRRYEIDKIEFKKIIKIIIGFFIIGFSIGVLLDVGIGVDPGSVLISGISNMTKLSYGKASLLFNAVLVFLIYLLDKSYVHISSFLGAFVIGYSANFGKMIVLEIFDDISTWNIIIKIILVIIWTYVMAFGIEIYISQNLGVGAIDSLSELISNRFKWKYDYIRILQDLLFVIVGFILGGELGIGTLICVLLTGPMIGSIRKLLRKNIPRS